MITRHLTINNRLIGAGEAVYLIAEMSANHNQSIDQAMRIVEAAKFAGADAIKLQTYTPDTLTLDCDNEYFRLKGTLWHGQTLHQVYCKAQTPWEWHAGLKEYAESLGLDFFSTPFDPTAVDFLEQLNVPAYKVASSELVDIPLLEKIGATQKPVIVSTGMASLVEIDEALQAICKYGNEQVALLKCTCAYPAKLEEMNLLSIPHMAEVFGTVIGISDHSTSIEAPVAAVSLGACIIEKHIALARNENNPDTLFALLPDEFQAMSKAVRNTEKVLGCRYYGPTSQEEISIKYRRSLFVVQDMRAGEKFTDKTVRSIRPGNGLLPRYLPAVLGRRARNDIAKGTPLAWNAVD